MHEYNAVSLLGRSAIRRRLLAELIDAPETELHLRELARRARTSAGTAARELARLADDGLVVSRLVGHQRFYRADTESQLHEPVRDLVRRTIGVAAVLRRHLGGLAGVERAVIFGSYADGRLEPDSDVDLLVIGRPNRDELTDVLETVSGEIGREVNEIVMTRDEYEARLARRDGFVESIRSNPTIDVVG